MIELGRFYSDPVKGVSEYTSIVYKDGTGYYIELLREGKATKYRETNSRGEAEEFAEDWVLSAH